MGKPKRKLSAYNLYMRRALKGKLTGKTEAQRKAIFKAAAKGWKKGKSTPRSSKPKSRASPAKGSNPAGGNRGMTKNSFSMSKIYSLTNKVAFIAPYAAIAMGTASPEYKVQLGIRYLTGFDMARGTWSFEDVKKGWLPYVSTKILTSVVPKITSFVKGLF